MQVREIWKCIHPRISYSPRALLSGNMILLGEYIFIFVKYYWQTYFKSIGTLSQTFKNHIHNNKEIQDQYPRENKVLFIGRWIVICAAIVKNILAELMEIIKWTIAQGQHPGAIVHLIISISSAKICLTITPTSIK
jgi:hypothetical protein